MSATKKPKATVKAVEKIHATVKLPEYRSYIWTSGGDANANAVWRDGYRQGWKDANERLA